MVNNIFCFFGVDGAGKTTTIEGVKEMLENDGKKVIVYNMNRAGNNKLFFIKWVMKIKSWTLQKLKVKPKGSDGESVVLVDIYRERGLTFLVVYYIDLWLRYLEAKRMSNNTDTIILMDRYFYDGLALSNKRWFKMFAKLTPKIKSFFLHAPPEVILERKKEATKDNIIDYTNRIREEFTEHFDITFVDTSEELNKVLLKVKQEVSFLLGRR